jgi:hypothetical protein
MSKILELIGFACVGGTVFAFLGLITQKDPIGWPLFWTFAAGALAVILFRKWKKKRS